MRRLKISKKKKREREKQRNALVLELHSPAISSIKGGEIEREKQRWEEESPPELDRSFSFWLAAEVMSEGESRDGGGYL